MGLVCCSNGTSQLTIDAYDTNYKKNRELENYKRETNRKKITMEGE